MNFIAWVLIVWASLQILIAFVIPSMIDKYREPYTTATAGLSMFFQIGIGALILALAINYLSGGVA